MSVDITGNGKGVWPWAQMVHPEHRRDNELSKKAQPYCHRIQLSQSKMNFQPFANRATGLP